MHLTPSPTLGHRCAAAADYPWVLAGAEHSRPGRVPPHTVGWPAHQPINLSKHLAEFTQAVALAPNYAILAQILQRPLRLNSIDARGRFLPFTAPELECQRSPHPWRSTARAARDLRLPMYGAII